jgi:nucleoside-diphosphate-sugar epimerase
LQLWISNGLTINPSTGANGISGFHTMRVLLQSPDRWSKVYALSRRPPPKEMMGLLTEDQRSRVQHVAVDFLEDPKKIADAMKSAGLTADYIFFYSYLQPKPPPGAQVWTNAEELVKVNSALLDNFLAALTLANIVPKRFLLQTGAKNYGLHIGRARLPAIESDPQPEHLEPNF